MDVPRNATDLTMLLRLVDAAGDAITGRAFDDSGLSVESLKYGDTDWQTVTLVAGTVGTFLASSWVELSDGEYQFCPANSLVVADRTTTFRVLVDSNPYQYGTINAVAPGNVNTGVAGERLIQVTIRDTDDDPVKGCIVAIVDGDRQTSDQFGVARIYADPSEDPYSLTINPPRGYIAPAPQSVTVGDDDVAVPVTLQRYAIPSGPIPTGAARCQLQVTAINDDPITGATMAISLTGSPSWVDDRVIVPLAQSAVSASGLFTLFLAKSTSYKLKIQYRGSEVIIPYTTTDEDEQVISKVSL